ncbi:MAG: cytochrome c oxidase subunit II [Sphingobacteriaceae bacterium]|nr:cytochrome c oxidase subunit II [Sphingobacteriaceae bacterium]
MNLRKLINPKLIAVITVIFTVFASTSVFAQAAADVTVKPVDMDAIYKSISYYVLLFVLLCMFVAIIGKALKIYELTQAVQDKPKAINWNVVHGVLFMIFMVVGLYGVYWEYTVHGNMTLPEAASIHGAKIDNMFNITLILTTIVFILTHIVLFGFAYKYKNDGSRAKAYFYPHNNAIERIWTIVPAVVLTVLVLMGFLTWRSIFFKNEDPNNKPIAIEVISSQFQWDIRYAGADKLIGLRNYKLITGTNTTGIDFKDKNSWDDQRADEIVLPVNKAVRFTLTSKDVIHSFYMPHFRVQMNTVPGMISNFEFTPTITTAEMKTKTNNPAFSYVLLCAKICGSSHYNMKKTVRVVSEEEYQEWLLKQQPYLNNDLRAEFKLPLVAEVAVSDPIKKDSTLTANQPALKK